jgi:tRNA(Ile)-lysidine synthase
MRSALSTRLLQHIREQNFVQPGDRVAVAVSGGADSVALLLSLLEVRQKLGITLNVAHFNHQLRGRASDADEKFVAALAGNLDLPFLSGCGDIAANARRDKANLEDSARRARYTFFDQLVAGGHATKVVVAHTADDQAETVLAHILRGTGLAGLAGIHAVSGNVCRPLLPFRRAELKQYLRMRQQRWREDKTNRDLTKTRARIRKLLLPLLEKKFQPAVVEHLSTLADLAREDNAWLDANAESHATYLFRRGEGAARIQVHDLLHRHPTKIRSPYSWSSRTKTRALSKRLIRLIVKEVKPGTGQLNAGHVQSILNLAERGENGKTLRLPGSVEVLREDDFLIFRPVNSGRVESLTPDPVKEVAYHIDFPLPADTAEVVLPVPCLGRVFRLSLIDWPSKRGETIPIRSVLDRDALRPPLVLRAWRPGDMFRPGGHRNAHKLKRLLNKKRIPARDRHGWPVLSSGGVLAWARGFPVAAEFAAGERTRVGILIAEEQAQ